jgi:hypothetical protein
MVRIFVVILLIGFGATGHSAFAQSSLYGGMGNCFPPEDPYPYKLTKSDPLYNAARDEHQKNLENLEDYVNCLDRERGAALHQLRQSFELFKRNYGKDAVFKATVEQ